MGIDDWTGTDNGKWFKQIVMEGKMVSMQNNVSFNNTVTIFGGKARGRTIGGNLSLVISLLGTKYYTNADFSGKILFLEGHIFFFFNFFFNFFFFFKLN